MMNGVSAVLSVALGFADGSERRRDVDWSLLGRGGPLSPSLAPQQTPFSAEAVALARAAGPLDWVARGAVNRPVSQGRCGTCAQFSATADVEAQWFLHGHALLKLSEQEREREPTKQTNKRFLFLLLKLSEQERAIFF